jgi:hypothetical protein
MGGRLMVIKAGAKDLQRTPIFSAYQDQFGNSRAIPVPEKDILDPVAEYNQGEWDCMRVLFDEGFNAAQDTLFARNITSRHYLKGYKDCYQVFMKMTEAQFERAMNLE